MPKIYAELIRKGFKTIDDVPVSIREKVEKIGIAELKAAGLTTGKELVKILGNGELTAKVIVEANAFSKTAEAAIKAAGGDTVVL